MTAGPSSAQPAGRFTDAVADFQARRPEVTVVCTGPWAPYSFAEAREADA